MNRNAVFADSLQRSLGKREARKVSTEHYTDKAGCAYYQVRRKSRSDVAQLKYAELFQAYVQPTQTVLDYGCGTGGILRNLVCGARLGVEINEPAIAAAKARGIEVFQSPDTIPDQCADVVISNHALEHVEQPLAVLRQLRDKLRIGGRLVIVVPAEESTIRRGSRWKPDDPHQHLYCWTPLTLGNLVTVAGFQVDDCHLLSRGHSHYIEWSRRIPIVYPCLSWLVARVASRSHVVCVAQRCQPAAEQTGTSATELEKAA